MSVLQVLQHVCAHQHCYGPPVLQHAAAGSGHAETGASAPPRHGYQALGANAFRNADAVPDGLGPGLRQAHLLVGGRLCRRRHALDQRRDIHQSAMKRACACRTVRARAPSSALPALKNTPVTGIEQELLLDRGENMSAAAFGRDMPPDPWSWALVASRAATASRRAVPRHTVPVLISTGPPSWLRL